MNLVFDSLELATLETPFFRDINETFIMRTAWIVGFVGMMAGLAESQFPFGLPYFIPCMYYTFPRYILYSTLIKLP
jgi:hypothetical protein